MPSIAYQLTMIGVDLTMIAVGARLLGLWTPRVLLLAGLLYLLYLPVQVSLRQIGQCSEPMSECVGL